MKVKACFKHGDRPVEYDVGKGCPNCSRARKRRSRETGPLLQTPDMAKMRDITAGHGVAIEASGMTGPSGRSWPRPDPKTGRIDNRFRWDGPAAQKWWEQADDGTRWACVHVPGMALSMGWPEVKITSDQCLPFVDGQCPGDEIIVRFDGLEWATIVDENAVVASDNRRAARAVPTPRSQMRRRRQPTAA